MKLNYLKTALDSHTKLGEEIARLQTLQQKSANALIDLEANGNLEDADALDKIARLRVQAHLAPARITILEGHQDTSLVELLAATEEFVENTLRPKIKILLEAAVEKVKTQLASIYSGQKLTRAINESDIVVSLNLVAVQLQRDAHPSFPEQYVAGRMAVFDQLTKIEKTL